MTRTVPGGEETSNASLSVALILTLAAIPIPGFGCIGVGKGGSWPPGTEVIVSTGGSQMLAHVPDWAAE